MVLNLTYPCREGKQTMTISDPTEDIGTSRETVEETRIDDLQIPALRDPTIHADEQAVGDPPPSSGL